MQGQGWVSALSQLETLHRQVRPAQWWDVTAVFALYSAMSCISCCNCWVCHISCVPMWGWLLVSIWTCVCVFYRKLCIFILVVTFALILFVVLLTFFSLNKLFLSFLSDICRRLPPTSPAVHVLSLLSLFSTFPLFSLLPFFSVAFALHATYFLQPRNASYFSLSPTV